MRPGSSIWLSVAGPFAQFLPREPGWCGCPSSLRIASVSWSTYATSPQAASQLKHVVGTSVYLRSTFFGHAEASYSVQSSHLSIGGKDSSGVICQPSLSRPGAMGAEHSDEATARLASDASSL